MTRSIDSRAAYGRLQAVFARSGALRSIQGLLDWDSNVMLPSGAVAARAAQQATIVELQSATMSDPRLVEWAEQAQAADLNEWESANLREMRRELVLNAATPADLAVRLARAGCTCEMAWRAAKAASDFAAIRPALEEVFAIARDLAAARGAALALEPFDAMMEVWEPGARVRTLDPLFVRLIADLKPLMAAVYTQSAGTSARYPTPAAIPSQRLLGVSRALAAHLGFSSERLRLETCAHAFFMDDNPDDIRIGISTDEHASLGSLRGLIHEIGHAHYESNCPREWRGQPVGRPRSAAIQESQALVLEKIVGGTELFWRGAAPIISAAAGLDSGALSPVALARQFCRLTQTPVRIEADELSYGLHIALRYRLERDLIESRLAVADLPEAWNQEFRELFGFVPVGDAEGCLQDIHWYRALLGYFPSYAQGQWAAAQFVAAAERELPGLWTGEGRLADLSEWLRSKVHEPGSRLSTQELIVHATGADLSPDAFLIHARRRYLDAARS